MKAKELNIGDLVWYDKTIKVERNYGKSIAYKDGNRYYGVEQSYIQPIPLTEDILKANGFEKSKDVVFMILKHTSKVRLIRYIEKWDEDEPVEYRGHWAFEENFIIDYVHQLQHALRLCGLNGLADNFKLKKD